MTRLFKVCMLALISALFCHTAAAQTVPKITRASGMFYTIDLVSPQIVIDTASKVVTAITFRLEAPNAEKVTIDGDFLPAQMRPVQMSKNESGLWEYTYSPPEKMSGLFTYVFYVDGLRFLDPSNINIIRNDTQYYNFFVLDNPFFVLHPDTVSDGLSVTFNNADSLCAKALNYAARTRGSILHTWYRSDSLKMDRRMSVYLPAGYFAPDSETKRYKVLYLLHGMGGDEDSWLRFGRLQQIMDYLISEKYIDPLIVVMPNGNVDVDAAPGQSALGYTVPDPYLPHTMDGIFEKYFIEIVNFTDANFRTEACKKGRSIAGYSMGGLNALWIALNHPDTFSNLGLFSPAVGYDNPAIDVYANFEEKLAELTFKDFDKLIMCIGKDDFLKDNFDKLYNKIDSMIIVPYPAVAVALEANTYKKGFDLFHFLKTYSEGGHVWENWRDYLISFLRTINYESNWEYRYNKYNKLHKNN